MTVKHLTLETFKKEIFNFEQNKEWKFEGDVPAIIDFYANWCGPCKMMAPILEELKQEYGDEISIYKIDTEQEQALSKIFGIKSIPSILFIPKGGKPKMVQGAIPIQAFKETIADVFKISK